MCKSGYYRHRKSALHQENTKKNSFDKKKSSEFKTGTIKKVFVPSTDSKLSASALNLSTVGSKDDVASLDQNTKNGEPKPVKNPTSAFPAVKKSDAKLKFCEVCKKFYKVLSAHMKTEKHLQNMKTQKQDARRKKVQAKLMLQKEISEKQEKQKIQRRKVGKQSGKV